eukprot:59871-Chlamydomonas_euryale.AAC.2
MVCGCAAIGHLGSDSNDWPSRFDSSPGASSGMLLDRNSLLRERCSENAAPNLGGSTAMKARARRAEPAVGQGAAVSCSCRPRWVEYHQ